jgi:hypothetical protein
MWSSIVDDFLIVDATEEEIIEWSARDAYEAEQEEMTEIIEALKAGRRHRRSWISWKEALRTKRDNQ